MPLMYNLMLPVVHYQTVSNAFLFIISDCRLHNGVRLKPQIPKPQMNFICGYGRKLPKPQMEMTTFQGVPKPQIAILICGFGSFDTKTANIEFHRSRLSGDTVRNSQPAIPL